MKRPRPPLLLCVLDGFGEAPPGPANSISLAEPRFWYGLREKWPATTLQASGEDVGLPCGLMGNSEVGHLNIGAGRVVYQEITRIDREIREGRFQHNEALLSAIEHARKQGGALHLFGLVSDGGVHSSDEHLKALLGMAKREDAGAILRDVHVPALVITGDEDAIIGRGPLEMLARAVRGARIETIEDAGHLPNLEQPVVFNRVLAKFLSALPAAAETLSFRL